MTTEKTPWRECKCPKCEDSDSLDVAAHVWVRLTDTGSDADESNDGSHEWGDEDAIQCIACGHSGKVAEFRVKEEADAVSQD